MPPPSPERRAALADELRSLPTAPTPALHRFRKAVYPRPLWDRYMARQNAAALERATAWDRENAQRSRAASQRAVAPKSVRTGADLVARGATVIGADGRRHDPNLVDVSSFTIDQPSLPAIDRAISRELVMKALETANQLPPPRKHKRGAYAASAERGRGVRDNPSGWTVS